MLLLEEINSSEFDVLHSVVLIGIVEKNSSLGIVLVKVLPNSGSHKMPKRIKGVELNYLSGMLMT